MLNIKDFKKDNQPPFDLTEEDYVSAETLIGKVIDISGIIDFENDKGPGVYLLFTFPGEDAKHYTTTHAGGILRTLDNADLRSLIEDGEVLEATVNRRPSKKDKNKTVWELI